METYNMNMTLANLEGGRPEYALRYENFEGYSVLFIRRYKAYNITEIYDWDKKSVIKDIYILVWVSSWLRQYVWAFSYFPWMIPAYSHPTIS